MKALILSCTTGSLLFTSGSSLTGAWWGGMGSVYMHKASSNGAVSAISFAAFSLWL